MPDIDRSPTPASFHNVHTHICPECKRPYSCNCQAQYEKSALVCIDCERSGVHGA